MASSPLNYSSGHKKSANDHVLEILLVDWLPPRTGAASANERAAGVSWPPATTAGARGFIYPRAIRDPEVGVRGSVRLCEGGSGVLEGSVRLWMGM